MRVLELAAGQAGRQSELQASVVGDEEAEQADGATALDPIGLDGWTCQVDLLRGSHFLAAYLHQSGHAGEMGKRKASQREVQAAPPAVESDDDAPEEVTSVSDDGMIGWIGWMDGWMDWIKDPASFFDFTGIDHRSIGRSTRIYTHLFTHTHRLSPTLVQGARGHRCQRPPPHQHQHQSQEAGAARAGARGKILGREGGGGGGCGGCRWRWR